MVVATTTPSLSCSCRHSEIFKDTFDSVAALLTDIHEQENLVRESESELLPETIAFRDELRYVAKLAGIELSSVNAGNDSEDASFEGTIQEIGAMVKVMSVDSVQSRTTDNDTHSIVYINVASRKVFAVSKATLLQAPAGAILANFASDVGT